ncbi:MAG: hypothetical protein NT010_13065 [Proteobacteria bacterium]|nr:hypothetical protein [Pseudomonadota bacterium]
MDKLNQQMSFPDEINKDKLIEYVGEWTYTWPFIRKIILYKAIKRYEDTEEYCIIFLVNDIKLARTDTSYPYDDMLPIRDDLHKCLKKTVYWHICSVDNEDLTVDPICQSIRVDKYWTLYQRIDNTVSTEEKERENARKNKLSEIDNAILRYVLKRQKKNPRLSIPDIAKAILISQEDFLYSMKTDGTLPKQETLEKRIRTMLQLHNKK